MKYPKRSQYKYAKKPYRVRNWRSYEAGLRSRGDLTVWISEDAIRAWRAPATGKPGGQLVYANVAIETALTLRMVLLGSLADKLGLNIPIPDHTTLSRRARKLGKLPLWVSAGNRPIHILIDSTGLRIHVGNRGKVPKRRAWRKLHVAVDARTGEVVASDLGSNRARDACRVPALLEQIESPLASARADGAYDTEGVYESIQAAGEGRTVRIFIPPSRGAQLSRRPSSALTERNRNIRSLRRLGRREWHRRSGYSRRSMVENGCLLSEPDQARAQPLAVAVVRIGLA